MSDREYAAVCPSCGRLVYRCDAQRCCPDCGTDLVGPLSAQAMSSCEHVAVCPSCVMRVHRCDEERCCSGCGTDLIVCADLYSAELLMALLPDPGREETS